MLLSAFFWSYALAQPIAGHFSQRYNVKWVLAVGLIIWAGATLLCGFATGFLSLLLLRIVMGVGESVIFPANAHIFAEHAPNHQRGRYNAVISMGTFLGPSAGTLVGGLILASYGWQACVHRPRRALPALAHSPRTHTLPEVQPRHRASHGNIRRRARLYRHHVPAFLLGHIARPVLLWPIRSISSSPGCRFSWCRASISR